MHGGKICHAHCPDGSSGWLVALLVFLGSAFAAAVAVGAALQAVGGAALAVLSAVAAAGVVLLVVLLRRGPRTWRPARLPSRRVVAALAAAEARAVAAAERPAIEAPGRLPVYVITDAEPAHRRG